MILPDGRKFRHTKVSATAGVAGNCYQQNALSVIAGTADADMINNMAASAMAVGALKVYITLAGTAAVAKDLFADGYMFVADSAGQGRTYKIKGCGSAAAGSSLTIDLYETDPIVTAVAASSSKIGLRQNEYDNITITTADTVTVGPVAGILPVAASASFYCWAQRSGPVSALNDNTTLIVGEPVGVSAQLAGALGILVPGATASVKRHQRVGYCMNVASASAKYGLVNLDLE